MPDTSGKTIKNSSHMQDWKAWEENDGKKIIRKGSAGIYCVGQTVQMRLIKQR